MSQATASLHSVCSFDRWTSRKRGNFLPLASLKHPLRKLAQLHKILNEHSHLPSHTPLSPRIESTHSAKTATNAPFGKIMPVWDFINNPAGPVSDGEYDQKHTQSSKLYISHAPPHITHPKYQIYPDPTPTAETCHMFTSLAIRVCVLIFRI
jgi:hypothetical protein